MMRSGLRSAFRSRSPASRQRLARRRKSPTAAKSRESVRAICHVVADDQTVSPTPKPPAPSFSDIAARPDATEAFLRDFLMKPHGQARALTAMPGFLMPGYQADAAIAYLMSLKPK
jgi:hypothetical protein